MTHTRRVNSGSPYEGRYGFSRAVRVGDRVLVSGTAPVLPGGGCPEGVREQAQRCCQIIVEALAEVGASPLEVVRTRIFIARADIADEVGEVHGDVFGSTAPAATMVVCGLLDPRWLVEIEAEAVVGAGADGDAGA